MQLVGRALQGWLGPMFESFRFAWLVFRLKCVGLRPAEGA
jgi:hypothetical protein